MLLRRGALVLVVALFGSVGCAYTQRTAEPPPVSEPVAILVVDEGGRPLEGATVTLGDDVRRSGRQGALSVNLARPVVAVVSLDGYLDEPVAIAPRDRTVIVRLWDRTDDDGRTRISTHFGGDVMMGRRYLDPDRSTPYVDDAESARGVVNEIAPLSATADVTVVNLETVVGEFPDDEALEAKRFLLQSTPHVMDALDEMGVDVVTLGNNHAYDWGEVGLTATIDALEAAGQVHVGAGGSRDEAVRGRVIDVAGIEVGIVSLTTVNGDYVNDQLPGPDVERPVGLLKADRWQYDERLFPLRAPGEGDDELADLIREPERMRISEAWEIFDAAEQQFDADQAALTWAATIEVFPELQDWVARRGHGGAAPYRREEMQDEVARLQRGGADIVVVQIHGGYQFADVGSRFIRSASRAAIDAGADAVISHHPHVLQGVEWYRGKLIAYSLGNLVFDQDFLSTFPSAMLRVITDGTDVLEARFLPLVLDRYRPTPLTGEAAQRVIRTIDARTALAASSARVDGRRVGSVLADPDDPEAPVESERAVVRFDRNSGVVERQRVTETATFDVVPGASVDLPACTLVRTDLLAPGTEVGVDLFEWGHFDRDTTDASRMLPVNWLVPREEQHWSITPGPSGDPFDLALELATDPNSTTTARIRALADFDAHRLYDTEGRPIDGDASYEIFMSARRNRGEIPNLRLSVFDFDDTDPTVEPSTERVAGVDLPIEFPDDGEWHDVSIPVPDSLVDRSGPEFNAGGLLFEAPPALLGDFAVDDVEIIEWRGATDADTAVWSEADRVRSSSGRVELEVSGC